MSTLHDFDRRAMAADRRAETRAAMRRPNPFRIVDELPVVPTGRRVPEQRAQLIAFAKQNPGKWIVYEATEEDPIPKPNDFAAAVRQGRRGFDPKGAFESQTIDKKVYLRFVGAPS